MPPARVAGSKVKDGIDMTPEEIEDALNVKAPADPAAIDDHVHQLLMRAQVSWLSKKDVLDILTNWQLYNLPISLMPPDQPGPGSLFLFDRNQLKSFRRDNHVWKSKAGGKTVQETHEKLKIDGGIPALNCYYAHSADGLLQRRCYWKLAGNPNIVLVHYRSPVPRKDSEVQAAMPLHLQARTAVAAYNTLPGTGHVASSGAAGPGEGREPVPPGASPGGAQVGAHGEGAGIPPPQGSMVPASEQQMDGSLDAGQHGSLQGQHGHVHGDMHGHGWHAWAHKDNMDGMSIMQNVAASMANAAHPGYPVPHGWAMQGQKAVPMHVLPGYPGHHIAAHESGLGGGAIMQQHPPGMYPLPHVETHKQDGVELQQHAMQYSGMSPTGGVAQGQPVHPDFVHTAVPEAPPVADVAGDEGLPVAPTAPEHVRVHHEASGDAGAAHDHADPAAGEDEELEAASVRHMGADADAEDPVLAMQLGNDLEGHAGDRDTGSKRKRADDVDAETDVAGSSMQRKEAGNGVDHDDHAFLTADVALASQRHNSTIETEADPFDNNAKRICKTDDMISNA